jgi:starch phosphorylase
MEPQIAYFSMEVAIDQRIPSYSGGLGVLAGDTIRSCADLGVPLVGLTLLSRKGYFFQKLDPEENQIEEPVNWPVDDFMEPLPERAVLTLNGRKVTVRPWRYIVEGADGRELPVLFLDADLEENDPLDRELTSYLYGGDARYRLCQEAILGIGGVKLLSAMGYNPKRYHINEGHAALAILELSKRIGDLSEVRKRLVFTTHTPVPAGHDKFPRSLVEEVLGNYLRGEEIGAICPNGELNMTALALEHSHYVNGVAKRHGEVSRDMFPGYQIDSITNGVHHVFWASGPFRELYDSHIPDWRQSPFSLRYAISLPSEELFQAHMRAKRALIDHVNRIENVGMDRDVFTLGFARRFTRYKRPYLLFTDLERLKSMDMQIVLAGKAHPRDEEGKGEIKKILRSIEGLRPKAAFLENYDLELAKLMTAGSDLWLNTPLIPNEASGTSGMKAALNGVPSLSVLDGWWLEGHIENVTGWSIGKAQRSDDKRDAEDMYDKLERAILPMFYENRNSWIELMKRTIAINGSFFNSHRMIQQYVLRAYF